MGILTPTFFDRPADTVAHDLIGCRLHWHDSDRSRSRLITETEAYIGSEDLASHASKGRTKRTEIMFGPAGRFYVYRCYGLHWMLNVVTGPIDYPAAVLIRGLEDVDGPARLTKMMGIDGSLNGQPAKRSSGVWFSAGRDAPPRNVLRSPRIGVDYAGPVWSAKPYRFRLAVN